MAYYEKIGQRVVYVGGYLEDMDVACDPNEQEKLKKVLSKAGEDALWNSFEDEFQQWSSDGISLGMGVVGHHLFFQIRVLGVLPGHPLLASLDRRRDEVTFVSVGQLGEMLRVFIPLVEHSLATDVIRTLTTSIRGKVGMAISDPSELSLKEFGYGRREAILSEGRPRFVSFVF
jgi:hypothetical protein